MLLIRTDGGPQIGTGHVMRMLALAERAGAVRMACARIDDALAGRLKDVPLVRPDFEPGSAEDAEWTAAQPEPWVALDGYAFGAAYQERLRGAGKRLLLVDDYGHAETYTAELVLNQNLSASEALYAERAAHVDLLLGPTYALVREEFSAEAREVPARAERVLVTMGGADPSNTTRMILEALASLPLEVKAVVGPSNPHGLTGDQIVRNADMPSLMGWADVAISAGGITTYELALMGVPMLLVIVAQNQAAAARALAERGAGLLLGWCHEIDAALVRSKSRQLFEDAAARTSMIEAGRALVDGRGAERVLGRMGTP